MSSGIHPPGWFDKANQAQRYRQFIEGFRLIEKENSLTLVQKTDTSFVPGHHRKAAIEKMETVQAYAHQDWWEVADKWVHSNYWGYTFKYTKANRLYGFRWSTNKRVPFWSVGSGEVVMQAPAFRDWVARTSPYSTLEAAMHPLLQEEGWDVLYDLGDHSLPGGYVKGFLYGRNIAESVKFMTGETPTPKMQKVWREAIQTGLFNYDWQPVANLFFGPAFQKARPEYGAAPEALYITKAKDIRKILHTPEVVKNWNLVDEVFESTNDSMGLPIVLRSETKLPAQKMWANVNRNGLVFQTNAKLPDPVFLQMAVGEDWGPYSFICPRHTKLFTLAKLQKRGPRKLLAVGGITKDGHMIEPYFSPGFKRNKDFQRKFGKRLKRALAKSDTM